jgi:predicted nucleotidyltransferase
MSKPPPAPARYRQPYRYASPDIPLSAIKRFVRQIAEEFHPDKIILFGSYAYGTPHEESDVDLLVIMPCRNEIDQALRIDLAFEPPFSVDLIVRTPYHMKQGLKEGDCDWFLREVTDKGKVLYEAPNRPVGAQSRGGLGHGNNARGPKTATPRRGVLPLPASGGKARQGPAARRGRRRPKSP